MGCGATSASNQKTDAAHNDDHCKHAELSDGARKTETTVSKAKGFPRSSDSSCDKWQTDHQARLICVPASRSGTLPHCLCSTWGCSALQQCSRCRPIALVQGLSLEHTWSVDLWTVWVYRFWQKLGLEGTSPIFIHRLQGWLLHTAFWFQTALLPDSSLCRQDPVEAG